MQSRLEARWAIFFSRSGFDWRYEPQTFRLPNGEIYTPDFYLPEIGWLEIKATAADARTAEQKLRLFAQNRELLISRTKRREFYTICNTVPWLAVGWVHRWNPEPIEIENMAELYLLFCSRRGRAQADGLGMHWVDFVKACLSAAHRYEFEHLRPLSEWELEWRCRKLGTSFRRLSKAHAAGVDLPFSDNEIGKLRTLAANG